MRTNPLSHCLLAALGASVGCGAPEDTLPAESGVALKALSMDDGLVNVTLKKLDVDLQGTFNLGRMEFYTGDNGAYPIAAYALSYDDGTGWKPIPGASATGNTSPVVATAFTQGVTARKVRRATAARPGTPPTPPCPSTTGSCSSASAPGSSAASTTAATCAGGTAARSCW